MRERVREGMSERKIMREANERERAREGMSEREIMREANKRERWWKEEERDLFFS